MKNLGRGRLSIAFVCMVLGFLAAFQFSSAENVKSAVPQQQRIDELSMRINQLESENKRLKEGLEKVDTPVNGAADKGTIDGLKLFSGQVPVKGPGVVITLDDSSKNIANDDPNLYLVHDEDMLKVINELRAAGAEAISINGQRLIATSEIRCAGPTVSVNNVRSAPPFEIRAIGSIKDLVSAINMRGGVADTLKVWGIQLDVKEEQEVFVPAYVADTQFKYAVEASDEEIGL